MSQLIVTPMPTPVADSIKIALTTQITAATPYKVGLTDSEKIGARSMALGREGLARLISKIANTHTNSLAREHNPVDLANKLIYDSTLEDLRQQAMSFLELITETQLANSVDIMKLVDAYADNLQTSRKLNASLDAAMAEVDEWNQRFTNSGNTTPR